MDIFKQLKWNSILLSALIALIGLIVLFNPSAAVISLCFVIGVLMLIIGAGMLLLGSYFKMPGRNIWLVLIVLGFIIIVLPELFANFVSLFLGLIILIYAVASIREATENKTMGYRHWYLGFIIGIITLVLSVLVLLNPFESASAVMMLAGASMLVHGISNIISILVISNDINRMMR